MIKASVAYEMMEKALHLIPSHESNSTYLSAYGVFNLESGDCVAVRAANHGTFLYNWLKMQDKPFNVDLLTSANIAITFLDGSIPFSQNNNIEMDNGAEPPVFVVRQYVYNCVVLDANDINVIISASKKLIVDGVYTDPFEEDSTKHAIIYREKTNEPSKDMTAKTLKKHRAAKKKRKLQQPTDNDNQELNTEQYMNKKLKKLTESYLHRVVSESIYKVIKEDSQPSQLGIDPDKIARFLFDNGIDVYQFTHQVEDVYEMLQSENQSSDPRMTLVNTIKNSSDFDDTTEQYGCQAGDAPLSKPIGRFSITRLGFILNNGKVRFYGFRVQDGEWIDNIEFGEEQIPQIISLIR